MGWRDFNLRGIPFSHGAAIHAKLHQPKIRIREARIPGSRDPDAGIRIREAGARIPGSGSWARGPKPSTGLRAPGSEVPGRNPWPVTGPKGPGPVCRAAIEVHLGVGVIAAPCAKLGRAGRATAAPPSIWMVVKLHKGI